MTTTYLMSIRRRLLFEHRQLVIQTYQWIGLISSGQTDPVISDKWTWNRPNHHMIEPTAIPRSQRRLGTEDHQNGTNTLLAEMFTTRVQCWTMKSSTHPFSHPTNQAWLNGYCWLRAVNKPQKKTTNFNQPTFTNSITPSAQLPGHLFHAFFLQDLLQRIHRIFVEPQCRRSDMTWWH